MDYLIERYGDLRVYWTRGLDGGGRSFGQHFVPVVTNLVGRVRSVFDFCSGAGFIGFSLLSSGLCETLTLADINPDAIEAAAKTVRENGLENRVRVYQSDCLHDVPESERWDLVVGNPPHFCADSDERYRRDIIRFDPAWRIHKEFYRKVGSFLEPHGSVILLENYSGSDESVFAPFLAAGNLAMIGSFMYGDETELNPHYFIWSRRRCDLIIGGDKRVTVLKVAVSELRQRCLEKEYGRFEKVRIDIVNDEDQDATIGLQTRASGPDITVSVRAGSTRTTGTILTPGGPVYVTRLTNNLSRACAQCEI